MDPAQLTVIVNVGDDDDVYGARVCADLDTVVYTLAGSEGPHGWGMADDTFTIMEHLAGLGVDTTFRLGDRDLAVCLRRTSELAAGTTLSESTASLVTEFGIGCRVIPASDDPLRTRVQIADGTWLDFQDYFVHRAHRDPVKAVRYDGAESAAPAPGAVAAIESADLVIIAPSNPPLSIWPILAIPDLQRAVAGRSTVVAVSPLFRGKALKGPADRVMAGLGLPPGNAGVVAAYEGTITDLVIDEDDRRDAASLGRARDGDGEGPRIHVMPTRMTGPDRGAGFAHALLDTVGTMRHLR